MTVPAWTDRLVEVNRPGASGVCIAHLHPGDVSTSFQQSLMNSMSHDSQRHGRLVDSRGRLGLVATQAGAGTLDKARNDAVVSFLVDHPEADLLLFADSDMGWDGDAVETLAELMDETGLPIVGGLCFGQKVVAMGSQHSAATEWFPTLYAWSERGAFDTKFDYPPDRLVEVAATGAAFLMISRRCLETMANTEGPSWFTPTTMPDHDRPFGEDMSFCIRARRNGFPVHVYTGVATSHRKDTWITESDYLDARAPASSAVTVVIPVKDNLELTRALVGDLHAQGGYSDILLFDNGSTDPEMVEWLGSQGVADVFDASGAEGISHMWNAGIAEAISRHHGLADVVFLNNDLRLGPRFLRRLVRGLRSLPGLMAVCGNYDRRPGSGVSPLRGIAAGREDGSGGLAGFAFALRAEWLASGFRFDEDMAWWFSDNDLCLEVEKAGAWYGLVHDASVTHVGGGSKTDRPEGWDERTAKDRKAFEAKWPQVRLTPAA